MLTLLLLLLVNALVWLGYVHLAVNNDVSRRGRLLIAAMSPVLTVAYFLELADDGMQAFLLWLFNPDLRAWMVK